MSKSRRQSTKPGKPYPDYPLFPHDSGRWAKKIRGKLVYFGRWGTMQGGTVSPVADVRKSAEDAAELYQHQRDDLQAGRRPREVSAGVSVRDVCNGFLHAKRALVDAGEMKHRTWADYHAAAERVADSIGRTTLIADLRPDDFTRLRAKLAERMGPVPLGNAIQRIRSIFKWASDSDIIAAPVKFGPEFRKPKRLAVRKARQARPKRLLAADEIRRLVDEADAQLAAMILLGINCGLGNTDCAELPRSAVDLEAGVLVYPRPKTMIHRRAILWPETVKALRAAWAKRPTPTAPEDADLWFVTKYRRRWVRSELREGLDGRPRLHMVDSISREFAKLLTGADMKRDGVNFYALRHTFQTIAEGCGDFPAIQLVMGHENASHMDTHYREEIGDERLRRVAEHVRGWAFPRRQKPAGDVVGKIGPDGEGKPATRRARRQRA